MCSPERSWPLATRRGRGPELRGSRRRRRFCEAFFCRRISPKANKPGKPPMDRVRKKKRRKRKKERERREKEGGVGRERSEEGGACWAWQLLLLAGRLLPALFCASVHLFAAFACRAPSKFSKTRFPFSLAQASPSYEAKSPRPAAPSGARQSRRRLRPFGHPLLLFHGPLLLHEASTSVSRRPYPAISHSPTKDQ